MRDAHWISSLPIAHRGLYSSSAGRPENSLAAFEYAVRRNVPFEFDIQLGSDGTLVVVHDIALDRVAGVATAVAELTAGDLTRLRLEGSAEKVPVLQEVLRLVNGKVPIVLDVRRYHADRTGELEKAIARQVADYPGELALQSFDPMAVARFRRLAPERIVGQVSGALRSAGAVAGALGRSMVSNFITEPDYISFELDALPSPFARFWRARGMPLVAWTVTTAEEEISVRPFADNFFFSDYVPEIYRGAIL